MTITYPPTIQRIPRNTQNIPTNHPTHIKYIQNTPAKYPTPCQKHPPKIPTTFPIYTKNITPRQYPPITQRIPKIDAEHANQMRNGYQKHIQNMSAYYPKPIQNNPTHIEQPSNNYQKHIQENTHQLSKTCQEYVQNISTYYQSNIKDISKQYHPPIQTYQKYTIFGKLTAQQLPRCIQKIPTSYPNISKQLPKPHQPNTQHIPRIYPKHTHQLSETYQKPNQNRSTKYPYNNKHIFNTCPPTTQTHTKNISKNYQSNTQQTPYICICIYIYISKEHPPTV